MFVNIGKISNVFASLLEHLLCESKIGLKIELPHLRNSDQFRKSGEFWVIKTKNKYLYILVNLALLFLYV